MSLVELARYPDSAQAHIVKGRLEAAGIGAHCFDSGMNLAEGVPMLFAIRLMVLDADLDAARALLAEDVPHSETPEAAAEEKSASRVAPVAASAAPERKAESRYARRQRVAKYVLLVVFGLPLLLQAISWLMRGN